MPCRIDYAINAASDGDEVVVGPGTYAVTTPLDAPAIDLHGVAGQAAPLLVGDDQPRRRPADVRERRHAAPPRPAAAASPANDALELAGGLAEDLAIVAVDGDGAKVMTDSDTTTVLRDSVVVAETTGTGPAALKLREGSGGALAACATSPRSRRTRTRSAAR